MTDREAMRSLVMAAYAARGGGDIEGLMSAFHPDAVFELLGHNTVLEVAGAAKGHPNIRASMAGLIAAFAFNHRDVRSFVVDGERAAVHSRIEVTFIPTGRTVTTDVLDLFRFADGKIVELLEFADTALIKHLIATASSSAAVPPVGQ